jgi:predicted Zn-dependent protease
VRRVALACALALISTTGAQQPPVRGFTAAPLLARAYDAIFDARFDEVPGLLETACAAGGPESGEGAAPRQTAPKEACQVLDVVALLWRIQLDPPDTSRDAAFRARADAAIAAAEAWTKREPARAEAWFYLGGAYGARVQWRVLREEGLSAAFDGRRIKNALERALELDPTLQDAYFGIGLYRYYADVAPAAARMFRWLLFLPGGDRERGLAEMLRAREGGQLVRSEADYQLHLVYLWYERQPARALELLEGLRERHPRNPHFLEATADIQDEYLHDLSASLRSWQALLDLALQDRVSEPALAATRARLGIAQQLDRLFETDAAIEHLRIVIRERPTVPYGAYAQAELQIGEALDRLGERGEALAAYRAAAAAAGPGDRLDIAKRAREGMRRTPDAEAAEAYRLSLTGWRALQRKEIEEAERALTRSLALRPGDPVTRYRQARLLIAQRKTDAALAALDGIVAARAATPPTIYASACLDAARLYEARGDRSRAIDRYTTAAHVFGADQRTIEAARRAARRLSTR